MWRNALRISQHLKLTLVLLIGAAFAVGLVGLWVRSLIHAKAGEKGLELLLNHELQGLNAIPGFKCLTPQGAFYAFPSIKSTGMTSEQFAEQLLMEEKVAVVPGTAFGPRLGEE